LPDKQTANVTTKATECHLRVRHRHELAKYATSWDALFVVFSWIHSSTYARQYLPTCCRESTADERG